MNSFVHRNLNHLSDRIADPTFQGSSIPLLIDENTGEMITPKSIEELKKHKSFFSSSTDVLKDVQYVELIIHTSEEGKLHFTLKPSNLSLSEKALEILNETLDLLNHCGKQCGSGSMKETLFLCVQTFRSALSQEIFTKNAWRGSVSREEAERLLNNTPPGTYLLREGDEYTKEMEENLSNRTPFFLHCYVITVTEKRGKVADHILIQAAEGWALYNDDLNLEDYAFKDLTTTIEEAGGAKPLEGSAA